VTTATDYLDGFQYQQEHLQFFPTAEGYAKDTFFDDEHHFNYVYQYKDHLGNVRVSYGWDPYEEEVKILEENNYYPYGLKHRNYNMTVEDYKVLFPSGIGIEAVDSRPYNYKYNGKEWQEDLGLNWYDYGARNYDAALGRWMSIDPMAEKYKMWSPYDYCINNPVFFVDPDGMRINPASQKEWNRQRQKILDERQKIYEEMDNIFAESFKKGWDDKKINAEIGDLQDRATSLSATLYNLSVLEFSDQVYRLDSSAGEEGGTTYDPKTGEIVFSFQTTANFVHEITHGGQFENGELAFDKNTGKGLAMDLFDEMASYKAQYAFDKSSVSGLTSSSSVNNFADITFSWVKDITKSDGSKIYSGIGILPANINSTREELIKAYPNAAKILATTTPNFTFGSSPSVYSKH
jgi:RHS repeat-associated protein